jgi:hypothetical protein
MSQIDRTQLADALHLYFSLGELRTLAFDLEIPYEDLAGRGKRTKVLSLVEYAERHGRFEEVINYVGDARPNLDWGGIPDSSGASAKGDRAAAPANKNEYHFHGPVVGSAIGDSSQVHAENIAGRDIVIGQAPATKEDFQKKLAALEALIQKAIEQNEIPADAAEDVQADVQDAQKEAEKENPSARRLAGRLEYVREVVEKAAKAAAGSGKAILKAAPIITDLIKGAQTLFQ